MVDVAKLFLSTPSARRATTGQGTAEACRLISIHALREEGDPLVEDVRWSFDISIHALREEGDQAGMGEEPQGDNFYPRPPRGGRPSTHKAKGGTT